MCAYICRCVSILFGGNVFWNWNWNWKWNLISNGLKLSDVWWIDGWFEFWRKLDQNLLSLSLFRNYFDVWKFWDCIWEIVRENREMSRWWINYIEECIRRQLIKLYYIRVEKLRFCLKSLLSRWWRL